MRLITRFQLTALSRPQLHRLHRRVFDALIASRPDSADRRNALASLETIETELAARGPAP